MSVPLFVLKTRDFILRKIRSFFYSRDFLEVETPLLSRFAIPDSSVRLFEVEVNGTSRFLQPSPELYMKKLLSYYRCDLFQISKVFRKGELSKIHLPEFTMLEWYRVGWNYLDLMDEVEELILETLSLDDKIERIELKEAFKEFIGVDIFDPSEVINSAVDRGLVANDYYSAFHFLVTRLVEYIPYKNFFLVGFPMIDPALAKPMDDTPEIAERFELFLEKVEIANGFTELRSLSEHIDFWEKEQEKVKSFYLLPRDEEFFKAVVDMPPSAGVALGIDRLLAVLLKEEDLAKVVAFDWTKS